MKSNSWSQNFAQLISIDDWWPERMRYAHLLIDFEEHLAHWLQDFGVTVHQTAEIDGTSDITGDVHISKGVKIYSGAVIEGPAYIGENCEIGPNCLLSGGVYIGKSSYVGHGAEIKSSIVLDSFRMFHFSYIGHSIVGKGVNIAAGVIIAVRRFDDKYIEFRFGERKVSIGPKAGAIIGNEAKLGVGVLVYPGRQIEPGQYINPGTIVTGATRSLFRTSPDGQAVEGAMYRKEINHQMWSSVSALWDKEADRFWSRNNIFLMVNGGIILFTLSSISGKTTHLFALISTLLGVCLAYIWLRVNKVGKYYLDRWKPILKKIERDCIFKPIEAIDEASERDVIPQKCYSSTEYMEFFIIILGVFWIVLFFIALLTLHSFSVTF